MLADVKRAADEIAADEGVEVEWTRIWQIDPIPFDETLVNLAAQAVGEITGDEDLVIQGTVKGKIQLKESLYVESSGVVEADIETQNVDVSGQVTGNITASDKVELKTQCRVIGDIKAPRVVMAEGAKFKGAVEMEVKLPPGV